MEYHEYRDKLVAKLSADLLGPGSDPLCGLPPEQEIITEHPQTRYAVGILYPSKEEDGKESTVVLSDVEKTDNPSEDGDAAEGDEPVQEDDGKMASRRSSDGADEQIINALAQFSPSAMGLSFFYKASVAKDIRVTVRVAVYEKMDPKKDRLRCCVNLESPLPEGLNLPEGFEAEDGKLKLSVNGPDLSEYSKWDAFFKELPCEPKGLKTPFYRLRDQLLKGYRRIGFSKEVTLAEVFAAGNHGCVVCRDGKDRPTLILRAKDRRQRGKDDGMISLYLFTTEHSPTFFQAKIRVDGNSSGGIRRFVSHVSDDPEEKNLAMLFRNKPQFALGHGCSVRWDAADTETAKQVETTFLPSEKILKPDYNLKTFLEGVKSDELNRVLDLVLLSDEDNKDEIIRRLGQFCENYESWINEIDRPEGFESSAEENIKNCQLALQRMRQGIKTLSTNAEAWRAFCLMNEAICLMQDKTKGKGHMPWRPFQLAFILLTISSIVNQNDDYRNWVDLLWFATGGGKTEAYLGLIAFTLFHRRMTGGDLAGGTAVIMRYTLRLLTSQQFTRAAELICACEMIRRREIKTLGDNKITIGLWVGGGDDGISNSVKGISGQINDIKTGKIKSPFQPVKCPWCKGDLSWSVTDTIFQTNCRNKACDFYGPNGPLPVQICDENLYKAPPSLLFATVDKFAGMPWKETVGSFFGIQNGGREYNPPELIIQDELHLISSELGSIVGLYECALKNLCRDDMGSFNYPKIIASTATARRAKQQCEALYACKGMLQFPPSGVNADDSYFSREDSSSKGRLYVAVMSAGKTASTMLIRTVANLLQRLDEVDWDTQYKDQYYTLVTYFNALRELGSCETWLNSDIDERMKFLAKLSGKRKRWVNKPVQLNSRAKSADIPESLDRLKLGLSDKDGSPRPVDVVLASNMLSVGIDVDRFGVMTVNGQPKTTAEYIQCTSRVGRNEDGSGLVLTVYNGMKPRDRSHFEVYPDYIQSFYRYVEPASLTPFSIAARKKALAAVLVTLVRHGFCPGSTEPADILDPTLVDRDELIEVVHSWAMTADPLEAEATKREVEELLNFWEQLVSGDLPKVTHYGSMGGGGASSDQLFASPGQCSPDFEDQWEFLTSARNVDRQCCMAVKERI